MQRKRKIAVWLGMLLAAMSIRCVGAVYWQQRVGENPPLMMGDSVTYWELGSAIATGRPYSYGAPPRRVMRAPGYPLFLAAVFRLFGQSTTILMARFAGALLGTITVAGIIWLAWWLFGESAGWTAGVLAALYPGGIMTSVLILSEVFFCPLMLAQIALTLLALRAPSLRRAGWLAIGSGVCGGMAVLTRPSWLIFTPVAWLVSCLVCREITHRWFSAAIALLGLVLVLTPWCLRNFSVTGHYVTTTLQTGASLYDGLNPRATGASDMYFTDQSVDAVWQRMHAIGTEQDWEFAWDQEMKTAARRWAAENPGQAVRLAAIKFARIWNPLPNEPTLRGGWLGYGCAAVYLAIIIPAAWALICRRFAPELWIWLVLPTAYFTALHMIFVGSIRYRQPPMLLLIVIAATAYLGWLRPKQWMAASPRHGHGN